MSLILASSLRGRPHAAAWDELAQERLGELDTAALLVYLVDTVSAEALPYLAEQFNVQGFKGYAFARTEQERRDLIAVSIELNRLKGTPFAVRRAVLTLDYSDVQLRENSAITCNGSWVLDGLNTCGSTNWANVVIRVTTVNPTDVITADEIEVVRAVVEEYKNTRTYVTQLSFQPYDWTFGPAFNNALDGWTAFQWGTQWYLWPMRDNPASLTLINTVWVNGNILPKSDLIIVEQIA